MLRRFPVQNRYHSYFYYNPPNGGAAFTIKYAYIGTADCVGIVGFGACSSFGNVGAGPSSVPNNDIGIDNAASVIVHEIEETATDPEINAWMDNTGAENADICAWRFSPVQTSGGKTYNMNLGGRNWLIQQNWRVSSFSFAAGRAASASPTTRR